MDVVAIKRSAGLSVTTGLDATFQDAIGAGTLAVHTDASSGQDLVDDAWLYKLTSGNAPYYNYGTSPGSLAGTNNVVHLTRFELSELPGFTGGQVVKAQLRYYLGIVGQAAKLEYQGGRTPAGT